MLILVAILIIMLAYFYGGFSTARILAKSIRSLNIYKVGSGLADTENIYSNVSKSMGIVVGALDIVKSYVFLMAVVMFLRFLSRISPQWELDVLYSDSMLLFFGLAMLIGHCLPLTNRLRGGRGIFTYIGYIAYFAFSPMLITTLIAWILVIRYHQIRFAQYLIVILPVILTQVFYTFIPVFRKDLPPHFTLFMLGIAFFMGFLNIMVSKRLGEF